jgi:vitamin B12 transporter
MKIRFWCWSAVVFVVPCWIFGQETDRLSKLEEEVVDLPEYILVEQRVANGEPVVTYAAPVTLLRFEPLVDLQTRNLGEAQGDVAIRGGIFENTAIQVGGWNVFDPQTGHYLIEVPISPRMLKGAEILTGTDHAIAGFNATVGTVRFEWAPIRSGGFLEGGFGSDNLIRGVVYAATENLVEKKTWALGADFEIAHSRSDGALQDGDHEFTRIVGRIQAAGESFQTNVVVAHQNKFFGWPNLYTPFGVAETEDIQTTLAGFSYRVEPGDSGWVQFGGFYRKNQDDYEFDRYRPGIYNPFEHETEVKAFDIEGGVDLSEWTTNWRFDILSDSIKSTALTSGPFMSRTYYRGVISGSRTWESGSSSEIGLTLGVTADDTNRDESFIGPLFELWRGGSHADGRWQTGIQFSRISQVPGYTAIGSSPAGGLFRGNPDLGREESIQVELNGEWTTGSGSVQAALFFRDDDPLVDWTFSRSNTFARQANPVAIQTVGAELVAIQEWEKVDLIFGYTWLNKDSDYLGADVDASFYALNFARHRFTAAVVWRITEEFELRSDNEIRLQEPNKLRSMGGDEAVLSLLSLNYRSERWPGLRIVLAVHNLWNSEFQDIPAVPAAPRQAAISVGWGWK